MACDVARLSPFMLVVKFYSYWLVRSRTSITLPSVWLGCDNYSTKNSECSEFKNVNASRFRLLSRSSRQRRLQSLFPRLSAPSRRAVPVICHFCFFAYRNSSPKCSGSPFFVKSVNEVTVISRRSLYLNGIQIWPMTLPQVTIFRGCRTKIPLLARIIYCDSFFLLLPLAQLASTAALNE